MSKVATKRTITFDHSLAGPPATLTFRLVLGGLSVALLALSCILGLGLAGWSVGASALQQLLGAAFPLLAWCW